ncbi:MAG: DegV family protein [Clostridiales bacterium]|jgi:DegV family protein with EDD domain|nr:DegV family protein [Clostridiales bacterium]
MVKIAADSTVDLGALTKDRDIHIIPLTVVLGDKTYYDGVTTGPNDILAHVEKTGVLPKTAARSVEEFKEFFEGLTRDGSGVVCFTISSKLSVTYENAVAAAKAFDNVYVVDTMSLSTGGGLVAMYGCDLRDSGKYGAKEIYERCKARVPRVQASFFVDTMEFLHKGGRCSGLTSFVAGVLKLKPQLLLKDGKIVVGKKFVGAAEKICTKYTDSIFEMFDKPDLTRVFITHTSAAPEVVRLVREAVEKAHPFNEIIETVAGGTVTCHCGKGTLGVLYINDGE